MKAELMPKLTGQEARNCRDCHHLLSLIDRFSASRLEALG